MYYQVTKEAEASKMARQMEADAHFYTQQREAEGLTEMAKAYGEMGKVLGGPQGLMQYMMLQNNTYERLANANAKAINGLAPKINVWHTGNQSGEGGAGADPSAPIRNLFQNLPPLLSTINDQTGITPPQWLVGMPQQQDQKSQELIRKENKMINGASGV
jgi:flotillin